MKDTLYAGMILGLALSLAGCSLTLRAQTRKRLWILQAPDTIVEYDPATFKSLNSHKIPPQAFNNPADFSVNKKGQMLFVSGIDAAASAQNKIWFWNGREATFLDRNSNYPDSPADSGRTVVEVMPRCILSADGEELYWFENEFRKLMKGAGLEISVSTSFRFWQTDLRGGRRQPLMGSEMPRCSCDTGVCSETCPEAEVWSPDGGVDDFVIITNWIPGQIGSDYQSSFVYHKTADRWSARRLPQPIIAALDAAQEGAFILHRVPDSGCCGWDNDSNDQTILSRNGKNTVLFDERKRYANPDYDISFFTSDAKLSPDLLNAAMTINASPQSEKNIRLASEGMPNEVELRRILEACSDLPAVEVLSLADPPSRSAFIPHSSLIGWFSDDEILLIEDQILVAFDPAHGKRRKSGIRIPRASYAFLR